MILHLLPHRAFSFPSGGFLNQMRLSNQGDRYARKCTLLIPRKPDWEGLIELRVTTDGHIDSVLAVELHM